MPAVARSQEIIFYKTPTHDNVRIEILLINENLWMPVSRIAELFDVQRLAVVKHIKNIYSDGELDEESTCSKMEQVRNAGSRMEKDKMEKQ